jgi:hypothetical protein
MVFWALAAAILAQTALGQVTTPRRSRAGRRTLSTWERWVGEPRNAVLFVLGAVILLGGGRRLLQLWKARAAVRRLEEGTTVTPESIEAVVEHGRAGLMELFRLLGPDVKEGLRRQAGHALSVLWSRDELIAEEEKAVVSRGWRVNWGARQRYPRALRSEIPVTVSFGLPFLTDTGPGIRPENLEWSYRVMGARRASLEVFSPWKPGPMNEGFTLVPSDFESNGPHKLVLQARARTAGLTGTWEMDLPHMACTFEFDPRLTVESLLTLPDADRAEEIGRKVTLEPHGDTEDARIARLNPTWTIRGMPDLVIPPLSCDLAHTIEVEFEGRPGRFPAGWRAVTEKGAGDGPGRFPVGPVEGVPGDFFDRPGTQRLRLVLTADPDRGWTDPDVRSVWPGTIITGWFPIEIVRS